MIVSENAIPCPVCASNGQDTKIRINLSELLSGVKFVCPECKSSIGMVAEQSSVKNAMDQLNKLKEKPS